MGILFRNQNIDVPYVMQTAVIVNELTPSYSSHALLLCQADIAGSIALQKISQTVQQVSSPPFACYHILGLTWIFVSNVAESTVLQLRYMSSQTEMEWHTKHLTCSSSSM